MVSIYVVYFNSIHLSRESLLLLRNAIAAHSFTRIIDLVQNILGNDITGANDTDTDGYRGSIAAKPSPCSR